MSNQFAVQGYRPQPLRRRSNAMGTTATAAAEEEEEDFAQSPIFTLGNDVEELENKLTAAAPDATPLTNALTDSYAASDAAGPRRAPKRVARVHNWKHTPEESGFARAPMEGPVEEDGLYTPETQADGGVENTVFMDSDRAGGAAGPVTDEAVLRDTDYSWADEEAAIREKAAGGSGDPDAQNAYDSDPEVEGPESLGQLLERDPQAWRETIHKTAAGKQQAANDITMDRARETVRNRAGTPEAQSDAIARGRGIMERDASVYGTSSGADMARRFGPDSPLVPKAAPAGSSHFDRGYGADHERHYIKQNQTGENYLEDNYTGDGTAGPAGVYVMKNADGTYAATSKGNLNRVDETGKPLPARSSKHSTAGGATVRVDDEGNELKPSDPAYEAGHVIGAHTAEMGKDRVDSAIKQSKRIKRRQAERGGLTEGQARRRKFREQSLARSVRRGTLTGAEANAQLDYSRPWMKGSEFGRVGNLERDVPGRFSDGQQAGDDQQADGPLTSKGLDNIQVGPGGYVPPDVRAELVEYVATDESQKDVRILGENWGNADSTVDDLLTPNWFFGNAKYQSDLKSTIDGMENKSEQSAFKQRMYDRLRAAHLAQDSDEGMIDFTDSDREGGVDWLSDKQRKGINDEFIKRNVKGKDKEAFIDELLTPESNTSGNREQPTFIDQAL